MLRTACARSRVGAGLPALHMQTRGIRLFEVHIRGVLCV